MRKFLTAASAVAVLTVSFVPTGTAGEIGHRNPTPATSAETFALGSTNFFATLSTNGPGPAISGLFFAPMIALYEFISWAGGTIASVLG